MVEYFSNAYTSHLTRDFSAGPWLWMGESGGNVLSYGDRFHRVSLYPTQSPDGNIQIMYFSASAWQLSTYLSKRPDIMYFDQGMNTTTNRHVFVHSDGDEFLNVYIMHVDSLFLPCSLAPHDMWRFDKCYSITNLSTMAKWCILYLTTISLYTFCNLDYMGNECYKCVVRMVLGFFLPHSSVVII